MFGNLFAEDCSTVHDNHITSQAAVVRRGPTGFCGLSNLGATCYLNTLLQTLFLTPEFRSGIFKIDQAELGDTSKGKNNIRCILFQLRSLFARMLQLDVEYVEADNLVESFGWTADDAILQQDVQELNRVLFVAIERSLFGTARQNLISDLYKGITVNEEDFLDISLSITHSSTLVVALSTYLLSEERMFGDNKYHCEKCSKLVDAVKRCRLSKIPPILTISLLRFYYDDRRGRFRKDTKMFSFPKQLNMKAFCQNMEGDCIYDLYAVVVHRGELNGGHYHCLIKDINRLGSWDVSESLANDDQRIEDGENSSKINFMELYDPLQLLVAVVDSMGGVNVPIHAICQKIMKETGSSWNKRFRRTHGQITKVHYEILDLLKQHDKIFAMNDVAVTLTSATLPNRAKEQKNCAKSITSLQTAGELDLNNAKQYHKGSFSNEIIDVSEDLESERHWYDFDDRSVTPIMQQQVDKQFSGNESAYMLFYRRRSTEKLDNGKDAAVHEVPDDLIREINAENDELRELRDICLYKFCVTVYFNEDFHINDGVLVPNKKDIDLDNLAVTLQIDRRQNIIEIKRSIFSSISNDIDHYTDAIECYQLYIVRRFEGILQICKSLDNDTDVEKLGIKDGTTLFLSQVRLNESAYVSDAYQPLVFKFTVSSDLKVFDCNFEILIFNNMKLSELCKRIMQNVRATEDDICLARIGNSFLEFEYLLSLGDIENSDDSVDSKKFKQVEKIYVSAFLKCKWNNLSENCLYSIIADRINYDGIVDNIVVVEIEQCTTAAELKVVAASRFRVEDFNKCRFKTADGNLLHDDRCIREYNRHPNYLSLILESGNAVSKASILLTYEVPSVTSGESVNEIILDRESSVRECVAKMQEAAGLEKSGNFYLTRFDVWSDASEALNDLNATLSQLHIKHGDHLILEKGRCCPDGFGKMTVKVFMPIQDKIDDLDYDQESLSFYLLNDMQAEYLRESYKMFVNQIEIALDSVLQDLKILISTLPEILHLQISSTSCLRIYDQQGNRCKLMKGESILLKNLGMTDRSTICVQLLKREEILKVNSTLLYLRRRVPNCRAYNSPIEVVFEYDDVATVSSFKQRICNALDVDSSRHIAVAKHQLESFDWIAITEPGSNGGNVARKARKNRGKKKHPQQCLLDSPVRLRDGDTIGIKDVRVDPDDDFSTIEDDKRKASLESLRKDRVKNTIDSANSVGVKINMDFH